MIFLPRGKWIAENQYFVRYGDKQQHNAALFWSYMLHKKVGRYSIAAMLGNATVESGVNPGIWENLAEGDLEAGFGLFQWTPASKYINWSGEAKKTDGYLQCERIFYELDNNLQWIETVQYPVSFEEFLFYSGDWTNGEYPARDEKNVKDLTDMFLKNYERPADPEQPERGEIAWNWFKLFTGNKPPAGRGFNIYIPTNNKPLSRQIIDREGVIYGNTNGPA